jgi:Mg-chelatase subunit ChlD
MASDFLTSGCPAIADIIIILDESTSIVYAPGGYDNFYIHMLGFVKGIVKSFKISPTQTRVGLLKFSEGTTVSFYLDKYSDSDALVKGIGALDILGGETNIAAALRRTRLEMFSTSHGSRSQAKKVTILITDGEANRETSQTLPEADLAKQANIEIYTVGITNRVNSAELLAIASTPSNMHYYAVDDYARLGNILSAITNNLCNGLRA